MARCQRRGMTSAFNLIITPGEVMECGTQRRPAGLDWEHLTAEKIAAIPILAARAAARHG